MANIVAQPQENIFLIDKNIGFNIEEPYWKNFLLQHSIKSLVLSDLNEAVKMLHIKLPLFAFVPAAVYYAISSNPQYKCIASATKAVDGSTTSNSVMVVKNDSSYKGILDLKDKTFGRLQYYTTSSYFAMALLLAQTGFSIDSFFKSIVDIPVKPGSYQEQINQVIEGKVDTTMVNEDSLLKLASNTQNTRILGRVNKLPNHVILLRNDADPSFEEVLKSQFYGVERKGFDWLSGFKETDTASLNVFFNDIRAFIK